MPSPSCSTNARQAARVRIEDLLREVDCYCHFTREFRPLGGYEARAKSVYPSLLAALIAHGTNLGIAAMGQSAQGITIDMLQHVNAMVSA